MSETLNFEFFSHSQKGVEFLLCHVHLPMIHEVEHCHQVDILDTFEVEEGVGVRVLFQDTPKERGASREYNFVCLHLLVITGQGHIKEVFVLSQLPKGNADVCFKVVPSQAELLACHFL